MCRGIKRKRGRPRESKIEGMKEKEKMEGIEWKENKDER